MPDIDIDFADRDLALSRIKHIRASRLDRNDTVPHNTGIYLQSIPVNPITNLSTIDYKTAEDRGYFKLDFLNVSIYKDVILGIELKVWRDKKRDPQADGIEQLESYLGRLGLDFGWLFIFDRRKNALPMEERLSTEVVVTENQYRITVIRA